MICAFQLVIWMPRRHVKGAGIGACLDGKWNIGDDDFLQTERYLKRKTAVQPGCDSSCFCVSSWRSTSERCDHAPVLITAFVLTRGDRDMFDLTRLTELVGGWLGQNSAELDVGSIVDRTGENGIDPFQLDATQLGEIAEQLGVSEIAPELLSRFANHADSN